MKDLSRRDLFLGGAAALLPLATGEASQEKKKLKVIAAGGHPDDFAARIRRLAPPGEEVLALLLRGRPRRADPALPSDALRRYHVGRGAKEGSVLRARQPESRRLSRQVPRAHAARPRNGGRI